MKTAIIYHYFEANLKYKDNFVFFLNTAIEEKYDYYIYISGSSSVKLPKRKNIKYRYIEDKNNDFGRLVKFHQEFQSLIFSTYIFINCSVRGPFLPSYFHEKWDTIFSSKLSKNIVLVGSSINLLPSSTKHSELFSQQYHFKPPYIHVQTTAYALSRNGYKILLEKGFFNEDRFLEKNDLICRYEILMSQIILASGHSIGSILPTQYEFNNKKKDTEFQGTTNNGDPLYKYAFYGRSLSPLEIIFIKTNSNMISNRELASYTFTSLSNKANGDFVTKDGRELQKRSKKQMLLEEPIFTLKNIKAIFKKIKKRIRAKKRI